MRLKVDRRTRGRARQAPAMAQDSGDPVWSGLWLSLVAAAVGGFLWWRNYQSTPAYTLTLMVDAAQRNDLAEFQKRIDDEEIAKNMVASVSQKAAGRYGFALNSSIQQRIDTVCLRCCRV